VRLQLNLTERLFGSKLGVKPLYFRPPYSIDQEPDTNDQAAPAYLIQKMGYTIVGNKNRYRRLGRAPAEESARHLDDVLEQLQTMKTKPQFRGSIILLHDGGGNRSVTVATLPVLIDGLRAHGYAIEQVSDLMGKTRAEVMPPLNAKERWQARVDSVAFFAWAFFNHFVVMLFFWAIF
jgi:peptidoglycan/xylan/chitin deacetylase (PgdA/CDA1 family)